ncbi:uncharacterized protein BCR38DRAFT_337479 [Pseudomassariella vexata]|uniref:Uncharacterized protein n=1 Tax=Pseudomassariella vexata TaxID=1141098 RepID=A0A1Y2E880_9PEZI|nr:uncharacterized protein BCR38DRAFT_337479 [Pseudomassariella vexata]ORY67760.1 hypothetical protein BCR38DRAFT_337479 [Pseudomassariella vexata]
MHCLILWHINHFNISLAYWIPLTGYHALINSRTWVLKEFVGRKISQYDILSCTWERDEITFSKLASE